MDFADTIAAIATAKGRAALGIIRISGPCAAKILSTVVPGTRAPKNPRRMSVGLAKDPRNEWVLDQVMCIYSRGPQTATGEDTAEIHAHGGPVVLSQILTACLNAGARTAYPGEFTSRAFANDRIDLTQAEAVMSLIGAQSARAARVAVAQLAGSFGARLGGLFDELTSLCAGLEAGLDFPDEDLPQEHSKAMSRRLDQLAKRLRACADTFTLGSRLTNGATVVLAGPTNAGKSSLLNMLAENDRALVDDQPGTTRDIVEARIEVDGIEVVVLDTAGLRESPGRVEQRGMERSTRAAASADLLLLVLDGTANDADLHGLGRFVERAEAKTIVVQNKKDLPNFKSDLPADLAHLQHVEISAVTGQGTKSLKEAMASFLGAQDHNTEIILTTSRQHEAVSIAAVHTAQAAEKLASEGEPELAATDLRWARESLASLWGKNATDEVIDAIFSRFCLGK